MIRKKFVIVKIYLRLLQKTNTSITRKQCFTSKRFAVINQNKGNTDDDCYTKQIKTSPRAMPRPVSPAAPGRLRLRAERIRL